jgi:hypothetical protein
VQLDVLDVADTHDVLIVHHAEEELTEAQRTAFLQEFELRDDDDRSAGFSLLNLLPRSDGVINERVRGFYAPAYIEIQELSGEHNKDPDTAFALNTQDLIAADVLGTDLDRLCVHQNLPAADRADYWYHYVVLGYQYTDGVAIAYQQIINGRDGDHEGSLSLGETLGFPFRNVSVIFLEGIRDAVSLARDNQNFLTKLNERIDQVVAHEIGRGPTSDAISDIDHLELGIMIKEATGDSFTAKSLSRFRRTKTWDK